MATVTTHTANDHEPTNQSRYQSTFAYYIDQIINGSNCFIFMDYQSSKARNNIRCVLKCHHANEADSVILTVKETDKYVSCKEVTSISPTFLNKLYKFLLFTFHTEQALGRETRELKATHFSCCLLIHFTYKTFTTVQLLSSVAHFVVP
jgi:hypothetical protein